VKRESPQPTLASATTAIEGSEDRRTRVLVVTVNYRTAELVLKSLEKLAAETTSDLIVQVAVVDNDSSDGSLDVLKAVLSRPGWNDWVTLIESPTNGGFSYGNNLAIRRALEMSEPPDFFFLLNPDAWILHGAIGVLVDFLKRNPNAGIAGSRLIMTNGENWPFAFRFPTPLSEFETGMQSPTIARALSRWRLVRLMSTERAQRVDWVGGASMMIRREVFSTIGLMDEQYFLYFEETDFCLQARRSGWDTWYVPESKVMHMFGQSTGQTLPTVRTAKRLPTHWFESRRRYFTKNHGHLYACVADLCRISGLLIDQARCQITHQRTLQPPHILSDLVRTSSLVSPVRWLHNMRSVEART
jgi:N-acetylglucosaminyl-diphospho-decaprenol L-rhamnosyltransferase